MNGQDGQLTAEEFGPWEQTTAGIPGPLYDTTPGVYVCQDGSTLSATVIADFIAFPSIIRNARMLS